MGVAGMLVMIPLASVLYSLLRTATRDKLREKGVPQELWDEALVELPEMDDAIDTFLRRKLDGRTLDAKQIKKTVDALLRRGHSYHDIQAGLRRYEASLSLEQTQEDTWEDME